MVLIESYMTRPGLPETFYWSEEPWGPALRCRPLEAAAPHVFTTRHLALSSQADWDQVAAALGVRRIATLTQVHGREVVIIRTPQRVRHAGHESQSPEWPRHNHAVAQDFSRADRPEGDILVSDRPDVALAVRAADCVPLLMADPVGGAVAAAHAGWRGTAAGAASAAVEALGRHFGAEPADLVAAIGPSIGACCYEVGQELIDAFLAAGHSRADVERWFTRPRGAAKPRLDTWASNRDQLQRAGVRAEHIHVAGLCTACHLELFPSFRKESDRAGRMAGAIRARVEAG